MPRRSAAQGAVDAAETLAAWLRTRNAPADAPERGREQAGAAAEPSRTAERHLHDPATAAAEPAVSVVGWADHARSAPFARVGPDHPDWLYHRLVVTGPAKVVACFRAAASGSGTVPWRLDLDRVEEDMFLLLAAPPAPQRRSLSLHGARILAGQLREAVGERHGRAVARVGQSRACCFDLHALVPVPDAVLRLGPDHPNALLWLWEHWGTTEALRHVAVQDTPARAPRHPASPPAGRAGEPAGVAAGPDAAFRLTFWSADWTPWRALARLAADWPALRFRVQPLYEGP